MIRLVLAWLGLMLLLGIEVVAAVSGAGWLAWAVAPVMIAIVVLAFMHVARESALARIFAITGLFWIAIMIGLGGADYAARRPVPAPQRTIP